MEFISIKNIDNLDFAKKVYNSSFPENERRDFSLIPKLITQEQGAFDFMIIEDNPKPIGILGIWKFEDFIFIEHFAVEKSQRNKSYGKNIMNYIINLYSKPIVLEVEPPTDKDSIRRIEFYSTLGFSIADIDYLQPPYAKNNPMLEMKLLIYNRLNSQELNLKEVINTIYSRVYNFNH